MRDTIKTAIYKKNVSAPERLLRVLLAIGMATASLYVADPWLKWGLAGSAVMAVVTGIFGFCPACYLAGRKLRGSSAP